MAQATQANPAHSLHSAASSADVMAARAPEPPPGPDPPRRFPLPGPCRQPGGKRGATVSGETTGARRGQERGARALPRAQPLTGTTCNTPRTALSGTSRLTKPGPKTASATYKIGAHPRPNVCPAPGEIIERLWM